MRHIIHLRKGFTLIELLVVMSIMGVLVAMGVYGYQTSLSRSRDQRRKADLIMVQGALENYKANDPNGSYPITTTGANGYKALADFLVPNYLPSLPSDPLSNASSADDVANTYTYNPVCNIVIFPNVCKTYTLSAVLENGGVSYVINQNGEVNPSSQPGGGSPNGL